MTRYSAGDGIYSATSTDLASWSSFTRAACPSCRHGTAIRDTSFGGSVATATPAGTAYRLTARHSGKVMDVQNPNTSDGAQIGQWSWSGNNWQKWRFVDAGGGYVRPAVDAHAVVAQAASAPMSSGPTSQAQALHQPRGAGRVESGQVEPDDGAHARGLLEYDTDLNHANYCCWRISSFSQQWRITDLGTGYYRFVNRTSGKCLDVSSAATTH